MSGRTERGARRSPQSGVSSVTIHGVLAGLALVAAYMTWTRDRIQVKEDQPVVLDYGKRDVERLNYQDESRTVSVERRSGADGEPYAWVTVTTRSKTLLTNPGGAMPPGMMPGMPPGMPPGAGSPHGGPPPGAMSPHGGPTPPGAISPISPNPTTGGPASALRPIPGGKAPAGTKGGEKAAGDKDRPAAGGAPAVAAANAPATAPATAPAAPAAPTPAPPPIHDVKETVTVKSFRGSDAAMDLLGSFAPLRAIRALGQVDENKAKELGFPESKKRLTVVAKGQTTEFVLGSTSYGGGDSYARDGQGRAFLLSQRIISDFDLAESRLMEHRLHRFERGDFDRIEVAVAGKKRTVLQKKRQDASNYFFVDATSPDKRDDTLKNWIDKVQRIAVSDYVAQGEEPTLNAPAPQNPAQPPPKLGEVMTIRYFDANKELGSTVFSRQVNPKSGQPEFYARTELTIGLVRLTGLSAESALKDAEEWR